MKDREYVGVEGGMDVLSAARLKTLRLGLIWFGKL